MKKQLVLAPAVALAITGLTAAPSIAAENAPTDADSLTSAHMQVVERPGLAAAGGADRSEASDTNAEFDPKITVEPSRLTAQEFATTGVTFTVSGLQEGDVVVSETFHETKTAEGDSVAFELINHGNPDDAIAGFYEVTFSVEREGADKKTLVSTFEIYDPDQGNDKATANSTANSNREGDKDGEAPVEKPKMAPGVSDLTAEEFNKNGLKVTGEKFTPNQPVLIYTGTADGGEPFFLDSVEADDEGKISTTITSKKDLKPGEYWFAGTDLVSGRDSGQVFFTLSDTDASVDNDGAKDGGDNAAAESDGAKDGGDNAAAESDGAKDGGEDGNKDGHDPAADAKLTVTPDTISPADFVEKDKGVTLTVENCEPGSEVRFTVNPKDDSNVTAFDEQATVDDQGKASVNVYGTDSSKPEAYVGAYAVKTACGEEDLAGAFTVGDEAHPGGSDGAENGSSDGGSSGAGSNGSADDTGDGGDHLPRTGAELTGLAAGAALLLVGGAAVSVTLRRRRAAQTPSDI